MEIKGKKRELQKKKKKNAPEKKKRGRKEKYDLAQLVGGGRTKHKFPFLSARELQFSFEREISCLFLFFFLTSAIRKVDASLNACKFLFRSGFSLNGSQTYLLTSAFSSFCNLFSLCLFFWLNFLFSFLFCL